MASACLTSSSSSISLSNGSLAPSPSSPRPDCLLFRLRSPPHSLLSLSLPLSRSFALSKRPRTVPSLARADLTTEEEELESDAPEFGTEEPDYGAPSSPPEGPKLYVGNLPWSCNSQELADVFQKVGSVEMVEVIYDRETGRSRGFGFVTMSSMEDATAAVNQLDGAEYGGRSLRVNFPDRSRGDAPPRPRSEFGPSSNTNKLFVGNLPWGFDDVSLEQLFSEHGKVVEAKIVYDRESGRSRGFGFVTLSSETEVNEAINSMDGAEVEGRPIRVNLAGERPAASRQNFF